MAYRELAARESGESSASVRARVEAAHTRQRARDPRSNATLPARVLAEVVQLDAEADRLLERAVERLALSARAIDRVRRVARTIADLENSAGVGAGHLAEALQYRLLDRPDP
jgi:magnesium chelatase family protein